MPLKRCQEDGEDGWKWGDEGTCYTGEDAKQKAIEQAIAMGEGDLIDKSDAIGGTMGLLDKFFGSDEDVEKRHGASLDALNEMSNGELLASLADLNVRFERLVRLADDIAGEIERRADLEVPDLELLGAMSDSSVRKSWLEFDEATDFATASAEFEAQSDRNEIVWELADALKAAVDSIGQDDDLSDEEKREMLDRSLAQFAEAMMGEADNILKTDLADEGGEDATDDIEDDGDEGDPAEKSDIDEEELEDLKKSALPGRGQEDALVMFVGASPSRLDTLRKKVFTGPVGKTVQDTYLDELETNSVYMTNLVPVYLSDDDGNPREPTEDEIDKWAPVFKDEVERVRPSFIVALGKTAKETLGEQADEFVPHPRAINLYGDSGEVSRKLGRLNDQIEKARQEVSKSSGNTEATIIKTDDERQVVKGVVLEPFVEDSDGNWTTPDEIEKAAHYFMKNYQLVGHEHQEVLKDAHVVENWVADEDMTIGGHEVKKGTWVVGIKIEDDERWEMVKSGQYTGFSIGAKAKIDPGMRLDKQEAGAE